MKILVTGGSGFLGSHVVRELLAQGYEVRVLKRKNSPSRTNLLEGLPVEIVEGDITNPEDVSNAVNGCEAVIHVAGHVSFWRQENETQNKINIEGTKNIVHACLKHSIKRLVHTSSVAAIGFEHYGNIGNEELTYNWGPLNINYNNSKQLAEEEVQKGVRQGLNAVIVNPAFIFGSGDLNFHGGAMIHQMARNKVGFYFDGGCCTCDVEDVAKAHVAALTKGKMGERYILGGKNYNWKDLLETMAKVLDVPPPKRKMPLPVLNTLAYLSELKSYLTGKKPTITPESIRISKIPCYYSSNKATRELGYQITPFEKTIEKTYRWYKENGYL
jgi:dihydroflavonol-4-reductase